MDGAEFKINRTGLEKLKADKLAEIVSEQALNDAWGNANFGGADKREIILDTLWKVVCGYGTGHTALCICTELGLIKGYRTRKGDVSLTKKGQHYFRECAYKNQHDQSSTTHRLIDLERVEGMRKTKTPYLQDHGWNAALNAVIALVKGEK